MTNLNLASSQNDESSARFVEAMGAVATGVCVVTTDGESGRFGLTVSAVASVSAEPPMLLVCLNRKSLAVAAIDQNRLFAVNILGSDSKDVAQIFSGRPAEGTAYDFDRHQWAKGFARNMPVLITAASSFECEVEGVTDAGTHRIFVGRVVASLRNHADPLIYCNRSFGRMTRI